MRSVIQFVAVLALAIQGAAAVAADNRVARGEYLVRFGGCNDCHTPGYFLGKPDLSRFLGGSDVGFDLPGIGAFLGPNLTPDTKPGWEAGAGIRSSRPYKLVSGQMGESSLRSCRGARSPH